MSWSEYFFLSPKAQTRCEIKKRRILQLLFDLTFSRSEPKPKEMKDVRVLCVSEMKKRQNKLNKEKDSYGGLQSMTPSTLWRVFLQRELKIDFVIHHLYIKTKNISEHNLDILSIERFSVVK